VPRPIFGTCTSPVLQQQRRGRAVATGQHSRTTVTRRIRLCGRTKPTWTSLHPWSNRSARWKKVRSRSLIRRRLQSSIFASFLHDSHSSLGDSASRLSQQVTLPAVLHGLITDRGLILPARLQLFRCQADVAQHSSRHCGRAVVFRRFFRSISPP
jgi:hypothetical protein